MSVLATFLHISDLHIGHRFKPSGGLEPVAPLPSRLHKAGGGLLGHHNKALDDLDALYRELGKATPADGPSKATVVTTGDLTQDGHLEQIALAEQFLGAKLTPPHAAIGLNQASLAHIKRPDASWRDLAIPGNHDHWPGPDMLLWPITVPYGSTAMDITGKFACPGWLDYPLEKHEGGKFIQFIRINTDSDVASHSGDRFWARGAFESQLDQMRKDLKTRPANCFRVLLMHHSPSEPKGGWFCATDVTEPSLTKLNALLEDFQIAVILSGHRHEHHCCLWPAGKWTTLEARCGSTTQREWVSLVFRKPYRCCTNSLMVHRVVEEEGCLWWKTYIRTSDTGYLKKTYVGTGSLPDLDGNPDAKAVVWPVDPDKLRDSFS
jgi:hypothetical protein